MFTQTLISPTKQAKPGYSLTLQKKKKNEISSDDLSHLGEEDNNDDLSFGPSSFTVGDYFLVKF